VPKFVYAFWGEKLEGLNGGWKKNYIMENLIIFSLIGAQLGGFGG
jgi:hypothetical protein